MATWVIGDVQGCLEPLQRLLRATAFDPARDRAILAGDLVNRGPDSAGVLHWCLDCDDRFPGSVASVLGNHDLHLLARAFGDAPARRRDTLDALLAGRDRRPIEWLARQPVVIEVAVAGGLEAIVVHAGLLPAWSIADLRARACDAHALLRGRQRADLLRAATGVRDAIDPAVRRAGEFLAIVTRIRACTAAGDLHPSHSGPPEQVPAGYLPWYEVPGRASAGTLLVFGHWAACGYRRGADWIALDSGCVWGQSLTALCLDDGRAVQVPARP